MRDKIQRFMQGRYGTDQFSMFLMGLGLAFMLLSIFLRIGILNYLGVIAVVYSYYRVLSRNHTSRFEENQRYLNVTSRLKRFFYQKKNLMKQRKTHRIFSCPSCKQKIRVPKGKGRIEVSCPKCRNKFIKRS